MNILITILHENRAIAETLKWSIEFASEKNTICEIAADKKTVRTDTYLLLADLVSFNRLYQQEHQPSCLVLLLTTNIIDNLQLAEALFTGIDAIADISEGPGIALAKIKNLLENKPDETQQLLLKVIQSIRVKDKKSIPDTDYGLTRKEKDILKLLSEANPVKQIAHLTNTSYETVRTHVKNIYKKIGVASASEAVIKALKMDLK